jgi:hypothetical protein
MKRKQPEPMGETMDITFDPAYSDDERRQKIFDGEIVVLPRSPATLALVSHARQAIEEAFVTDDPRSAHKMFSVEESVARLVKLKPYFIHHPETRELLRKVLLSYGCDPEKTYQDVPRIRSAFPANYLTTGIAYAHHPHRDTWYSAPMCQLNWWMPLYDFSAEQGMAFHPRYWSCGIANGSKNFNYYRWNADGRKNAAQHIKTDTRVQPHAEEPIELEPSVRCIMPAGSVILFSAAHLHSTVVNTTDITRWSIDFRTVHIGDVERRQGARNHDSNSSGTSLRDFKRMKDFTPISEAIVGLHDKSPIEGVAVYTPVENVG